MKNKIPMLILTFVIGAVIGAAIVWMLFNCSSQNSRCGTTGSPVADTTGIQLISPKIANNYFKTYLTNFERVDTLKGFSINAEQFNAMKIIAKADSSVHGFRIYMGMKDSLTSVRMVVGTGSPDKTKSIYVTSDYNSGPCPHICDNTSDITSK